MVVRDEDVMADDTSCGGTSLVFSSPFPWRNGIYARRTRSLCGPIRRRVRSESTMQVRYPRWFNFIKDSPHASVLFSWWRLFNRSSTERQVEPDLHTILSDKATSQQVSKSVFLPSPHCEDLRLSNHPQTEPEVANAGSLKALDQIEEGSSQKAMYSIFAQSHSTTLTPLTPPYYPRQICKAYFNTPLYQPTGTF